MGQADGAPRPRSPPGPRSPPPDPAARPAPPPAPPHTAARVPGAATQPWGLSSPSPCVAACLAQGTPDTRTSPQAGAAAGLPRDAHRQTRPPPASEALRLRSLMCLGCRARAAAPQTRLHPVAGTRSLLHTHRHHPDDCMSPGSLHVRLRWGSRGQLRKGASGHWQGPLHQVTDVCHSTMAVPAGTCRTCRTSRLLPWGHLGCPQEVPGAALPAPVPGGERSLLTPEAEVGLT